MLFPKKVKHRKWQKGSSRGIAGRLVDLSFGQYGLKSLGRSWVTSRQIEASRRAITRSLQRGGKLWIRVFPDKPVTQKGSEVTMGGGKGPVDHYVANVRPGMILFEIDGIDEKTARQAFRLAAFKLPIKTSFIKKDI